MIYFDLENMEMILPDGTGMDISTKQGANAFLRGVTNFEFFTTKVMDLEYIRPGERDRSIEIVARLLSKNVSKELFREKIPVLEIECWLQHSVAEIKKLATKPSWIPGEKLQEQDKLVLNQCSAMFVHKLPVALAFETDFFQVLTKFTRAARTGNSDLPSKDVCECVLSIVWHAFVTCTCTTKWSVKTTFKLLAASGILEEFIRCLMGPKLDALLAEGIETMLQQLQLCPSFLKKTFKTGDPCGNVLRAVLIDKAGIRKTRENIFQRLENIVLSVDSMDPTAKPKRWCNHCGKYDDLKAFRMCFRCRNACYCGGECQIADWNRHRRCCSSVLRGRNISLNTLTARVSNFMKSHYTMMMVKMVEECDKTSLKMQDMIIQLDFMPTEDGIIPALQDPPIFKIALIRDHVEGSPPQEPNWYHSRAGKYTYLCIDPIKKMQSNRLPNHVAFLVRCEDGIQCLHIDMDSLGTEDAVSALRSALRDGDFGPLSRIFGNEEASQLSHQIQSMYLHQHSDD